MQNEDPLELALKTQHNMATRGYNPIDALIDIAQDTDTTIKEQIDIHKTLLPYTTPKWGNVAPDKITNNTTNNINGGQNILVLNEKFTSNTLPDKEKGLKKLSEALDDEPNTDA